MPNDKTVSAITGMDEDFAQWYTDIVRKAGLAAYSPVRGCIFYEPYGYAIWELIQQAADKRFKETGHSNVYMPLLIPESLLQKEKDHIEGFAPEVAWVTYGGAEELTERFCIRPTSETLFCEYYKNAIESYRDLPKLYNQWCSVVRWEKTTRPFLRGVEFLWQEGHTAHATAEEALDETIRMLDVYGEICENTLALPVIKGRKTESEKFAGAVSTYGIESLMHDGKALQSGTTHFFGDGFAKAFGIQYTDKNNQLQYIHQSSWGLSTRLIGAVIMVHGDNNGLVLPPYAAPTQAVIVPIAQEKPGVLDAAKALKQRLSGFRTALDDTDKSPGWKFAEHEMRGIPLRLELGPRDIAANQAVMVRRDTGEKTTVSLDNIEETVKTALETVHRSMYAKALAHLNSRTFIATNMEDFTKIINETPGFIKAMWCGDPGCEEKIKEQTAATSRCIPFEQERLSDKCVCCGKEAREMVYWGKAY